MPFAPTRQMLMVVIELHQGQMAPAGADWVHLWTLPQGGCELEGCQPDLPGIMSRHGIYPSQFEASRAGIDYARVRGASILYVEMD